MKEKGVLTIKINILDTIIFVFFLFSIIIYSIIFHNMISLNSEINIVNLYMFLPFTITLFITFLYMRIKKSSTKRILNHYKHHMKKLELENLEKVLKEKL